MRDWPSIFDEIKPEPPATPERIAGLARRLAHPLPDSYQDFLRWSDGGWARTGDREFGFFGTQTVPEYRDTYGFAESMPGAVPFALDGGGVFSVFDLRGPLVDGECPVLACEGGSNFWKTATPVAASFLEACRGAAPLLPDPAPKTPAFRQLFLDDVGESRGKVFLILRKVMGLTPDATKAAMASPPFLVIRDYSHVVERLGDQLRAAGAKVRLS